MHQHRYNLHHYCILYNIKAFAKAEHVLKINGGVGFKIGSNSGKLAFLGLLLLRVVIL